MDYTPRFSQPFTLAEAIDLDVSVITEEISRLQNSLTRLRETQSVLEVELEGTGEVDPEITKALEENKVVIGSQEERISMLKMALTDKGITSSSHYDIPTASLSQPPSQPVDRRSLQASRTIAPQEQTSQSNESEADGGVFL